LPTKQKILKFLANDMRFEYARRCKRHAFYDEHGLGGKRAVESIEKAFSPGLRCNPQAVCQQAIATPRAQRADKNQIALREHGGGLSLP
jgi:hypothetical protein